MSLPSSKEGVSISMEDGKAIPKFVSPYKRSGYRKTGSQCLLCVQFCTDRLWVGVVIFT
jgi:hypothetical protein